MTSRFIGGGDASQSFRPFRRAVYYKDKVQAINFIIDYIFCLIKIRNLPRICVYVLCLLSDDFTVYISQNIKTVLSKGLAEAYIIKGADVVRICRSRIYAPDQTLERVRAFITRAVFQPVRENLIVNGIVYDSVEVWEGSFLQAEASVLATRSRSGVEEAKIHKRAARLTRYIQNTSLVLIF